MMSVLATIWASLIGVEAVPASSQSGKYTSAPTLTLDDEPVVDEEGIHLEEVEVAPLGAADAEVGMA